MSQPDPHRTAPYSEFTEVADRLRRWGKWGERDQIGALNFITPEAVREAATCVQAGKVFPLSIEIDAEGVWQNNSIRRNAVHLFVVDGGDSRELGNELADWDQTGDGDQLFPQVWDGHTRFADDVIFMSLQGSTQWDALSHVWYDEKLWNGYPSHSVTSRGATRNGIDKTLGKGIVGRAVLLDVARFRGVDHLPANESILPDELDAVCAAQGVTIRSGDILLVRTGWWSTFTRGGDGATWMNGCPGLHWSTADWISEHEIAAVASDNLAVEVSAAHVEGVFLPLHLICQRDMGVMFGEFWDLDALAADCAEDGRYEVQLVASPLNIPGAVGSPLTPIAMK